MKGLAVLFCAFALVACSQEGGQPEGSGESAAEVRTVTLDVQGMDCNGCVETVTKSVAGLDGDRELHCGFGLEHGDHHSRG